MQPRVRSFLKRRPGLVLALLSAVVFAAAGTGACSATRLAPAVPPGSQVDIFTQVPRAQSDILWIVDDSESMSREQDQLADSFPKFFAHLQDSGVDYRIAVTTADVIDNLGNLVGDPSVIVGNSSDPDILDTPDPQSVFEANIHVGTNGSPRDEALEAASLALSQLGASAGAAEDAGQSVLFLRPNAGLFLIFVGDGVDYSPDYALQGVQYYWRDYLQSKGIGNEALVQVAAIAGDVPNGCEPQVCGSDAGYPDAGDADPGVRYYELVELANGFFGSICDCSFDSTLDQLGLQALGLRNKFILSQPAVQSSLTVNVTYPCSTVDPTDNLICTRLASTCPAGVGASCTASCSAFDLTCSVPQLNPDAGALDGWTYGAGDNSITFTSSTQPGPDSQITVSYDVQGEGS